MPQRFFQSHTRLKPPLVLVVDDLDDVRAMCSEYLAHAGFRVDTAADGNEAVAKALALLPDVILMDLAMPALDGWEATNLLQTYEPTRRIPIIAVSAQRDEASIRRARDAGCCRIVHKPCDPAELHLAIRETLGRSPEPFRSPGVRQG